MYLLPNHESDVPSNERSNAETEAVNAEELHQPTQCAKVLAGTVLGDSFTP